MSDVGPAAADEPGREPPASRPPRPATAGHLIGRAEASVTRLKSHGRGSDSETTLTFRLLERAGQTPREVQLRGSTISGTVRDGDWVEVSERERSGPLHVGTLLNLTTETEVRVSGRSTITGFRLRKVLRLVVVVAVLLLIVWAALRMSGVVHQGWPFGDGGQLGGGLDGRLDPGSSSSRLPGVS